MSAQAESKFIEVGRPINEIISDLSKPIPEAYLRRRKQGGNELTYIPWHCATKLLDYYAPAWGYMVDVMHVAGKVVCKEGTVTRQATGYEDDDASGFGDPFSNAESMALRRAAAKFGLGRYLYK